MNNRNQKPWNLENFSSQVQLLLTRVLRRRYTSAFNFPIWTQESFTQSLPTRQPPLLFIDIALKIAPQLSTSSAIFQVLCITRLCFELPALYYYVALLFTVSLCRG